MDTWQESVYSDGTAMFVSDPSPKLGETVTISLRLYETAPVKHVILRWLRNGLEQHAHARRVRTEKGLAWYEVQMPVTETRMQYEFYLVTEEAVWFYTQKGISTCLPDHSYDFVLLTDYVQPAWVKEAVFYQIFPERFCNGDPANDVKPGEYAQDGHPAIHMANWEDTPLPYQEGFCLDFFGGDLEGIRQKIPYLKDLGVTALYLNPIFRAPSVHKYDCVDYFHVDPHFGGDEALAALSKTLHENDMKLILDISINHTGANHRWFNRDGMFFDKSTGSYNDPNAKERDYYFFGPGNAYHAWYGNQNLPTLNYTSEALRDVVYRAEDSVLRKWLKPPYSIDGWRFDVADTFARNDDIQLAHEVWPEIRKAIREENPQAYILAEDWGDCAQYMQGSEWDSPMSYFTCGRPIRQFFGQTDHFLAHDPVLRDLPYKMTAKDLRTRVTQHLARIPWALWENQFNLFDSHDISRFHNDPAISPMAWRGAVYFQFILTGAASIYYGDEASIDGTPGTNEGCRYPMPWSRDFTGCEQYKICHAMAHLKKDHRALSHGGMKFIYAEGYTAAIARFTVDEAFVAVINSAEEDQAIRLPLGAIGAAGLHDTDVMGEPISWRPLDENSVELTVPAGSNYFIQCEMK